MKIIELRDLSQFEECSDLQEKIWRFSQKNVIPSHIIKAYADPDDPWGIILGAYFSDKMIGFSLTLPTSHIDVYLLHMIGVLPEFRHQGIGYKLLEETKKIAKTKKAKKLVLTYDPLKSANANLYLNKHKGVCRKYVSDYYKRQQPDFPSDRFKVEIFIDRDERERLLGKPKTRKIVEIPLALQDLSLPCLTEWRSETRRLFVKYINEENYIVTAFQYEKGQERGVYLLEKY